MQGRIHNHCRRVHKVGPPPEKKDWVEVSKKISLRNAIRRAEKRHRAKARREAVK